VVQLGAQGREPRQAKGACRGDERRRILVHAQLATERRKGERPRLAHLGHVCLGNRVPAERVVLAGNAPLLAILLALRPRTQERLAIFARFLARVAQPRGRLGRPHVLAEEVRLP